MPSREQVKSNKNSQKKRLGRGLGSLLSTDIQDFKEESKEPANPQKSPLKKPRTPQKSVEVAPVQEKPKVNEPLDPKGRILSLAIEKVFPNKAQPRKDFVKEPLDELSESIKEQGVLQPITVRKKGEGYEIIAGERRWRASQLAGLKEVPAILKELDDQKSMEWALIENLQREDLNPVEEAMGYQHLMDQFHISQVELAKKVGKSRSAVTNALRVLVLPPDVKKMLRQGLISLGHAKVLLSLDGHKEQVQLARKTIKKNLSVRALENEVRRKNEKLENKASKPENLGLEEDLVGNLEERLQKSLGTKVRIQYRKGRGKVEISFYSDDELNGLSEKILG